MFALKLTSHINYGVNHCLLIYVVSAGYSNHAVLLVVVVVTKGKPSSTYSGTFTCPVPRDNLYATSPVYICIIVEVLEKGKSIDHVTLVEESQYTWQE